MMVMTVRLSLLRSPSGSRGSPRCAHIPPPSLGVWPGGRFGSRSRKCPHFRSELCDLAGSRGRGGYLSEMIAGKQVKYYV